MEESKAFFDIGGKEYCNESFCLSRLLADEVLFCNERDYLEIEFISDEKGVIKGSRPGKEVGGSTTLLYVNCNDIFAWGCADAEDLPTSEIGNLYKMHIADPSWGSAKWCCIRRNTKPQDPVIKYMKEAGVWDEKMEALGASWDERAKPWWRKIWRR